MRHASLLVVAAATIVPFFACGGGDKPADNPQPMYSASMGQPPPGGYPPGQYPPPGGTTGQYPPPGGTMTGQPPPGGTAPPPGGTAPPPAASGGLAGLPIDPNLLTQIQAAGAQLLGQGGVAAGDPLDTGLKTASTKYAVGMQPEGNVGKDQLAADGHRQEQLNLVPGKCYTIIAYSPPGQITNVDLHLLPGPLYNMSVGNDDTTDNTAVIGKGSNPLCPLLPALVPYKLDVHAKAGAGQVAVQVFSKNK